LKSKRGVLDWEPPSSSDTLDDVGTPEHQAAASRVALDSITVVRDERSLLPLSPDSSLLVVYPRGAAGMAEAIMRLAPEAILLEVGERPTGNDVETATGLASQVEVVIVGTRDVLHYPEQGTLVQALAAQKATLALALDSPYDLLACPGVSAYLASYGRAPASMHALAQVIFGLEAPRGRLPVDLTVRD
jgi:beta-N-acetylhexosaminidase